MIPDQDAAHPVAPTPAWRPSRAVTAVLLTLIVAAGAVLRFSGADWDAGHHLHPDERFLTMVGSSLQLPQDLLGYLDTDTSPMNPRNTGHDFFSYGSWPISLTYLAADTLERLRTAPDGSRIETGWRGAIFPSVVGLRSYGGIYLVGRAVSALLDLLTVLLVFGIAALLYDRRTGLLAAALVAFTAFHIQQAHFYTVDAPLTAFVMLHLFGLVVALRVRRLRLLGLLVAAVGLGMALASKVSVWLLVPTLVAVLGVDRYRARRPGAVPWWGRWMVEVAVVGMVSLGVLKVAEPTLFAGPGWPNVVANPVRLAEVSAGQWVAPGWWHTVRDVMPDALEMYLLPDPRWANSMDRVQNLVTGFGTDWPPNHQWWGRKGYWFPLVNMMRWGMGWPLGLAAVVGWAAAGVALARRRDLRHLPLWLWVTAFFAFQGIQWTKTLRYFLPIFAPLAILAAWWLVAAVDRAGRGPSALSDGLAAGLGEALRRALGPAAPRAAALLLLTVVALGTALWGTALHGIYRRDHPRVEASEWIYHNLETAFGLRLTAIDPALRDTIRGPWLPALPPNELAFEGHTWTLAEDGVWRGPMRVLVPGPPLESGAEAPEVVADALRVAFATDPEGDPGAERLDAVLSSGAHLDPAGEPEGVLVRGSGALETGDTPHALVALDAPVALASGGEYYLWIRAEGAPISGRPAILAYETRWDDLVPLGLAGYGASDNPETAWAEGLFGWQNFEMYGEDYPAWLDETMDGLANTDYWVSTSNRVYGAIAQLPMRYPATLGFYDEALFGEGFGFEHVASIASYPGIGPWRVPDQAAEEAFHVYDHPKVDVFRVPEAGQLEALRARLAELGAQRRWSGFPPLAGSALGRFLDALLGRIPVERAGADAAPSAAGPEAPGDPRDARDPIALDAPLAAAQRAGGTWRALFDEDGLLARQPLLAALMWYVVLALLGLAAFPLVGALLPSLPDRGWAVARTAGLLAVAWLAWLVASLQLAAHVPWLVVACAVAVAVLSSLAARSAGFDALAWARRERRRIAGLELVFLALYIAFLAIKAANPDLWHSHYGGEKPMDLAYLQAVLRSTYFPPYDPWFAGGRMNYYYFGFVLVGAMIELTRIVPWVAYNLAIASIAALVGTSAFGLAAGWLEASGHRAVAGRGGLVAAFLAVLSGNLHQVRFVLDHLASVGGSGIASEIPGVTLASRALTGALAVARGDAAIPVAYGHHWYWNASRAIPSVEGDTQPITEFPFFTFLYGDLHAHMMAMPIAMLALAVALGWALPGPASAWRQALARRAGQIGLGALAIGALWPTNAWDVPSFGLVAAGAIALASWRAALAFEPAAPWPMTAVRALVLTSVWGLALLGLAALLFLPFHAAYVAPYQDFSAWRGFRTPPDAYLIIHGLLLFPIVSWAIWRLVGTARDLGAQRAARWLGPIAGLGIAVALIGAAWAAAASGGGPHPPPSAATPAIIAALAALGLALLLLPGASWPDRFAGGLLLVGAAITLFVENVVLAGDIGRMNTVFKFYIHVWLLWSVAAGYGAGRMLAALHGRPGIGARAWPVALGLLLASGLLYTVTATRAKADDRFPLRSDESAPAGPPPPGLDGAAFLDWAVYYDGETPLELARDAAAFRWLRDHVDGTPTVLEAFRPHYRWGARYSIWTGLPAVIGWDWHQKQQRAGGQDWLVDERARDVEAIYGGADDALAWVLIDQYDVELVVVGELERALYDAAGLARFERWADASRLERAYDDGGVTIYRVLEGSDEPDAAP